MVPNALHNRTQKAKRSVAFCGPSLCDCYVFSLLFSSIIAGLISNKGVPLRQSSPRTVTTPFAIDSIGRVAATIGLGRFGDLSAKVPIGFPSVSDGSSISFLSVFSNQYRISIFCSGCSPVKPFLNSSSSTNWQRGPFKSMLFGQSSITSYGVLICPIYLSVAFIRLFSYDT